MNDKYKSILHSERPSKPEGERMTLSERASHFSPFAALVGYGDMIDGTNVEEAEIPIYDDEYRSNVGVVLSAIEGKGRVHEKALISYYVTDDKGNALSFNSLDTVIIKINKDEQSVYLDNGQKLMIKDIVSIKTKK
ncbi:MAG: hypothetical protein KBT31_02685 [Firmicutes bacterium]|nr:hypothetical protein [Candidatus Colimorpha enterica]